MNTVLVTGGAGYVGSHAVLALLEAGYRVVVLDNLSTGNKNAVASEAIFIEGDINNERLLECVFKDYAITAVMHFAASIVVPESVKDPLKYYYNNTAKSLVLIQACVKAGIKSFIFSSTAAVYGIPQELAVNEASSTHPVSPYGASKLMTERILQDIELAHGMKYVILRYFNVAGADPKGRTGQYSPQATHLIKVACQTVLGFRSYLPIFGKDFPTKDGTGVRDFIHVSDLVQAHVLALSYLNQDGESQLLNCGYGHGFSVAQVVQALEQVSGVKINTKLESPRAGDPSQVVSQANKIKQVLEWSPKYDDLAFILRTALDWEKKMCNL